MKKRKPNLVQRMWFLFAMQIQFAILITAVNLQVILLCLRAFEKTDQALALKLPTIRQRLQAEQDPVKLRREVNGLWDMAVGDGESWEWGLRFMIKMSLMFGFGLCVYSLPCVLFACKLQRQNREKDSPVSP